MDTASLTEPKDRNPLHVFPGGGPVQVVQFSERVKTENVALFGTEQGTLADISFYRVSRQAVPHESTASLVIGDEAKLSEPASEFAPGNLLRAMKERYGEAERRAFALSEKRDQGKSVALEPDRAIHFISAPFTEETGLTELSLDATITGPQEPFNLTVVVQDPLNPRLDLVWLEIRVSRPGRVRLVFDLPDQVLFPGTQLWLSLRSDRNITLSGREGESPRVGLRVVPREQALREALDYRKLLLKSLFSLLSEPRPWGAYARQSRESFYAINRYAAQCPELFMTIDQCHALSPNDPLVRQYREWVYLRHLALMARWFYGDPIYLERCMESARNMASLTVLTADGRRHFRNKENMGARDMEKPGAPLVDGDATPLMWHTALQVADYNRNPEALRLVREWADSWLRFLKPGQWATDIEVLTGKVLDSQANRPLYGGYRSQATVFTWLSALTGDARYLEPFLHYYRQGQTPLPANEFLGEAWSLGLLDELGGEKLARFASENAALALYLKGDAQPLVRATIGKDHASTAEIATLSDARRWPDLYTTAEPFTDRVFPHLLGHASTACLGGFTRRNKFNPALAVSWEGFSTHYAALVINHRHDRLKVLLYVIFKIDAPRDITRLHYGGRLYNRAGGSRIDFLHSFDSGKTWARTYSLTNTSQPWDVIHYETV